VGTFSDHAVGLVRPNCFCESDYANPRRIFFLLEPFCKDEWIISPKSQMVCRSRAKSRPSSLSGYSAESLSIDDDVLICVECDLDIMECQCSEFDDDEDELEDEDGEEVETVADNKVQNGDVNWTHLILYSMFQEQQESERRKEQTQNDSKSMSSTPKGTEECCYSYTEAEMLFSDDNDDYSNNDLELKEQDLYRMRTAMSPFQVMKRSAPIPIPISRSP
jgi:hypothetical protein